MTTIPSRRIALVTGAGKLRVGNVVATALAERGYTIALHYNRSAADAAETVERLARLGVQAAAFQADLAEPAQIERMWRDFSARFGRIDVLVNTAAIWERRPLDETTPEDVLRHFSINTLGTFLCCQHAGRIMVAQPEGGVIVNVGDWACERPYRNFPAYFLSKGALPAMTRMLAIELAHRNPQVRVNCVLPGPVMLPEDLSAAEIKGVVAATLVKRLGRPEHVAQAVISLIENDFVTGVCLPVDGGRTIGGGGD